MNHRKATRIAKHALMQCLTPDGIVAGTHHFVDLWARDSLFATFGSGASSAKTTIETFIKFQRNDGLIPYRVMWSKTTLAKYFGKPTLLDEPVAQYRSRQSGGLVLDGGLMTVITAFEYVHRSGDIRFFQKHQAQLEQVMHWYERRFGDGLLSEWFQCEWADGVLKAGQTLYTNVLYWKALGDIGDHTRQRFIGKLIRERLWNGKFFADWTDWKRQDYFASHPNMLAIIFGLANSAETEKILDFTKQHCWNGFTLETNYPSYPPWRIPILSHLVSLADYHNRGCLWLQPGILYSIALFHAGYSKDARFVLSQITEKINKYDDVYEVYEKSGAPVHRMLYQSEHAFAWSAGLFLWASHILGVL